jgi:hypothetical protein
VTWTMQSAPGDTGDQNDLSGVSCPSADTCVAVGTATTELGNGNTIIAHSPLIERWSGLSWSIQPSPPLDLDVGLSAVSCASETACIAVGDQNATEAWDGSAWTTTHGVDLGSDLDGVSCTSVANCIAVGSWRVAQTWDGTSWTALSGAISSGTEGGGFDAVSCPLPTTCIAVGGLITTAGSQILAAQYP